MTPMQALEAAGFTFRKFDYPEYDYPLEFWCKGDRMVLGTYEETVQGGRAITLEPMDHMFRWVFDKEPSAGFIESFAAAFNYLVAVLDDDDTLILP